ncbi:MAG TPA: site-2 protease family protein, partial [Cellvibrio sp.]|nr:site-2 protease family protein [Cellvibrio sp.]
MQLFSFDYAGRQVSVHATPATGEELVALDGVVVSQKQNFSPVSEHLFAVEGVGEAKLVFEFEVAAANVNYQYWINGERVLESSAVVLMEAQSAVDGTNEAGEVAAPLAKSAKPNSWLSLALVAFKLLKAVKVIQVALVTASVAVYSVMFTVEFAFALVAVLVFHEYGHLRAMKKCGLPTKGMYLIPFVGGLAVGDMPKSRWQDVYISMMGPVFGLLMTVAFYITYLITESHFAGLVASTSALLNLFNLIPVYPLDGGRVVKSLVFSGRNYLALVALLVISATCFVFAWKLGFYFITFFIVLGVIDIVAGWRVGLAEDIPPLNAYGIWFSVLWYLAVVGIFLG